MSQDLKQEEVEPGFDLRVHIRDPKSGAIVRKQPYRLHVIQGVQYFERPVGSFNLWYKSGEPAGRMVDGEPKPEADHVDWKAPRTHDDDLRDKLVAQDAQIDQLKRELDNIRREKKYQSPAANKKAE